MVNSSMAKYSSSNQTTLIWNGCEKSSFGVVFLPVSYCIVFLISLTGNMSMLFHYIRKEKSPSKLFTVNLATLDLLMTLTLPLVVDYRAQGRDWRFGETLCKVYVVAFYGNLYGGSLFMLCISVDRLLAVRYPLVYLKWTQRQFSRRLVCSCLWLVITVFSLWGLISLPVLNSQLDGTVTCGEGYSDRQWHASLSQLVVFASVIGFFLPYSVILSCYALIAQYLSTNRREGQRWKTRSLRVIAAVMTIMTICFLPFHCFRMFTVAHHLTKGPGEGDSFGICFSQHFLFLLATVNSALDPFVYYFLSLEFNISQLCSRRATQSKMDTEEVTKGSRALFREASRNKERRPKQILAQMYNVVHRLTAGPGEGDNHGLCFSLRFLYLLASLNSALDPFIYYFLSFELNLCCGQVLHYQGVAGEDCRIGQEEDDDSPKNQELRQLTLPLLIWKFVCTGDLQAIELLFRMSPDSKLRPVKESGRIKDIAGGVAGGGCMAPPVSQSVCCSVSPSHWQTLVLARQVEPLPACEMKSLPLGHRHTSYTTCLEPTGEDWPWGSRRSLILLASNTLSSLSSDAATLTCSEISAKRSRSDGEQASLPGTRSLSAPTTISWSSAENSSFPLLDFTSSMVGVFFFIIAIVIIVFAIVVITAIVHERDRA
ncbi:hypothetical protein JZ751_020130, partial [Albula glossodonta]